VFVSTVLFDVTDGLIGCAFQLVCKLAHAWSPFHAKPLKIKAVPQKQGETVLVGRKPTHHQPGSEHTS
jgi:hypothetical protein